MAKKRHNPSRKKGVKANKKGKDSDARKPQSSRRKSTRSWIGGAVAALILATVSFAGVASYQHYYEKQTDLSVIGNGAATVVQVHDPSCSLCKQLKSNTEVALKGLDDKIQYRIADLTSAKGRRFAAEHDSRKVTLVTFTRDGKFYKKFTGVRSAQALNVLFKELIRR